MKIKILFMAAVAALPVICSGAGGGPTQTSAPGTPVPGVQSEATAQPPGTTMTAPGTATNSINNNPNAQSVNGNRINGNSDVNGEGRGVYQNGYYYRNGTYGYNTNAGTTSGYANTNTLYWTTNPPEPNSNQRNTTQAPGNVLPTPINLPPNSAVAQPPGVNAQHPTSAPPAP